MSKTFNYLRLALARMLKYRYRLLLICVVLIAALSAVHYCTSGHTASARMSLNYSEASQGLNPNSTRFNVYEIVSKEVLEDAIESAGLTDVIEWDELAAALMITPIETGTEDDNYICTSYLISYDSSALKVDDRSLLPASEDMISLICRAYKRYFLSNYGENENVLDYEPLDTFSDEPYLRLNSLNVKLEQIYNYLEMRIQENKSYTDETTGRSFMSILKQVENMRSYDVSNINAYILESGISSDKISLVSLFEYRNRIEQLTFDTQMAYYDSDNAGIDLYDKAMSAIVMIPSIDTDYEFYMSRTKTAMDTMARAADTELQLATYSNEEITQANYVVAQMNANATSAKTVAQAQELIDELESQIDSIASDLKSLDISYIKYKTHNYLVFTYSYDSFINRINIKRTAVEVVVCLVVFYCYLLTSVDREQRRKQSKEARAHA